MTWSNGDGGSMNGNAAGKPIVTAPQQVSVINRPIMPTGTV
jgi:hypothetical protein